jgi:hypothetical protein
MTNHPNRRRRKIYEDTAEELGCTVDEVARHMASMKIDFEFQDFGQFFTFTAESDAGDEWIKNRDKPPGRLDDDDEDMIYAADREEAVTMMSEIKADGLCVVLVSAPGLLS